KQVAVESVSAGAITNHISRLTANTAMGEVSPAASQSNPAATNEQTVRHRSAASQRSAICPAIRGASSEPMAWVAQHQPISAGQKASSLSRNEKRGTIAPGAA